MASPHIPFLARWLSVQPVFFFLLCLLCQKHINTEEVTNKAQQRRQSACVRACVCPWGHKLRLLVDWWARTGGLGSCVEKGSNAKRQTCGPKISLLLNILYIPSFIGSRRETRGAAVVDERTSAASTDPPSLTGSISLVWSPPLSRTSYTSRSEFFVTAFLLSVRAKLVWVECTTLLVFGVFKGTLYCLLLIGWLSEY